MTVEKIRLFYEVIDNLVKFIRLHSKAVCLHQADVADVLNKVGVQLFFNKNYPTAKAYFWVSHMLGNRQAYSNYLSV